MSSRRVIHHHSDFISPISPTPHRLPIVGVAFFFFDIEGHIDLYDISGFFTSFTVHGPFDFYGHFYCIALPLHLRRYCADPVSSASTFYYQTHHFIRSYTYCDDTVQTRCRQQNSSSLSLPLTYDDDTVQTRFRQHYTFTRHDLFLYLDVDVNVRLDVYRYDKS